MDRRRRRPRQIFDVQRCRGHGGGLRRMEVFCSTWVAFRLWVFLTYNIRNLQSKPPDGATEGPPARIGCGNLLSLERKRT